MFQINTTYFLDCVAGNLFGTKTTPPLPSRYYLGLSSSEPNPNGTGVTEPTASGSGYARILLDGLGQPDNGKVTNESSINFEKSKLSWGTITHYVIFDAKDAGAGNLLMYGELATSRSVEAGTIMSIEPGCLELSVVNPE